MVINDDGKSLKFNGQYPNVPYSVLMSASKFPPVVEINPTNTF